MTAVEDAKATLASIEGLDGVWCNNIPSSAATDLTLTELLLTDDGSSTEASGNDDFHALTQEVEVQIWYARKTIDYEAIELAILKALTSAHWQVSGWKRRVLDPDTKQLSNTTYITRTINV
jgi:hypothetical protein